MLKRFYRLKQQGKTKTSYYKLWYLTTEYIYPGKILKIKSTTYLTLRAWDIEKIFAQIPGLARLTASTRKTTYLVIWPVPPHGNNFCDSTQLLIVFWQIARKIYNKNHLKTLQKGNFSIVLSRYTVLAMLLNKSFTKNRF